MDVENFVAYQVATDRDYRVGGIIEFGQQLNGIGLRVMHHRNYDKDGKISKQGFDFVDKKHIFNNKKLILKQSKYIDENDLIIRELATEYVRTEKFSTLPSRLHCMFLSEDKDSCLSNLKTFYKKGFGQHFQAVEVKLTGKIFYAKDVIMGRSGYSFAEYMALAEKYWSQDQNSKNPTKEILFEGKAVIVNILEEYYYKRK